MILIEQYEIDYYWYYRFWYQYRHVLAGQVYIRFDKYHQWYCKGKLALYKNAIHEHLKTNQNAIFSLVFKQF